MPGRPDFSQSGSAGSGQTVAVNHRPTRTVVNQDNTTSLAAGGKEQTEIYAAAGTVWQCMALRLVVSPDSTATSGTHHFRVKIPPKVGILYGEANYNSDLVYHYQEWQKADVLTVPSNGAGQAMGPERMLATETDPITVVYENQTDAAQDNTREIRMAFKEESY